MKIQCGQCERKYKVPDEKVGGKAFKVRCRNCESTIIVRPDGRVSTRPPAGAEQPAVVSEVPSSSLETTGQASIPSGGYAGSEEQADWHVVVDGDQQGPYAPVVLSEMLTVGTIDWDAYVWREGFDGWLPARDVPELVEAITGQPYDPSYASDTGDDDFAGGAAASAAAGGFAATTGDASLDADVDSAMDNVFGGGGDSEAEESPFAPSAEHESSSLGRGLSDSPAAGAGDFMDFGGGSSPPGAGGSSRPARRSSIPARSSRPPGQSQPPAGSSPAPFATGGAAAADESSMTGQRNENSVLFSLSNLQALAGQEGAQPAPDPSVGHASGDASGLIDIRALAGATGVASGGGGGTGGSSASGSARDDVDDLMSIGTGSALSANLAAPVLSAAEEDGDNKKWLILGGALFAGIVVLGLILALALGGDDDEVAMAPDPIPNTTAATAPTTPTETAQPSAVAEPSAQEDPLEHESLEDDEEEEVDEAEEKDDSSGSSSRRRRSRRSSGSSKSASSSSSSTPAKTAPEPDRKRDSIDDLLDEATGGGGGSSKKSSGGGGGGSSNLPDSPSKSQVVSAMNAVGGKVRACGQGQSGVAMVSVSVSGSTGRVKSANVSGSFQGTSTGSCIARAVRSAKFPKFKQSTFTVKYPFRI